MEITMAMRVVFHGQSTAHCGQWLQLESGQSEDTVSARLLRHVCDKLMNNVARFQLENLLCQKGQGWNKGQTNLYTFKMFFNKSLSYCNCFSHLLMPLFSSRLHFTFHKMSQLQIRSPAQRTNTFQLQLFPTNGLFILWFPIKYWLEAGATLYVNVIFNCVIFNYIISL